MRSLHILSPSFAPVSRLEGDGFERRQALHMLGKLPIEGGKLFGVSHACQMQRVGEIQTALEPVQGLGDRQFVFKKYGSQACQGSQCSRTSVWRGALKAAP